MVVSALAVPLLTAAAAAAAPLTVFENGRVVTVDPAFTITDAFAVEDGRIVAVGAAARRLGDSRADVARVDLAGRMVLPGLIDSHTHPVGAATHEFDHPIPDIRSIADLLAYVAARAAAVPAGSKIVVRQVFITRLAEQRYPTREELDRAAPDHPVVFSTGPDSMLNSRALALAGITRESGERPVGSGRIARDAAGEPSGLIRGFSPQIDAPDAARLPSSDESDTLLRRLFADYNRVGLTTIADRGASGSGMAAYERLRERGELTVRVRLSHTLPSHPEWDRVAEAVAAVGRHPLRREDPLLRIVGTKIWLDGGMLTGSALMREPWGESRIYGITDPAYRGAQNLDRDRLVALVRAVAAEGLQFTAHAVGDGATALLLDAYREVDREQPLRETRPCLTHSNFLTTESIAEAARMGVVVDLQPVWLHLDGDTLTRHFGEERMRRFQPLRPLFDAGVPVGGGSDHMQKIGSFRAVNPYNPFLGMWTAVSRQARRIGADQWPAEGSRFVAGRSFRPVHLEHALTREEAIRMYTIENAKVLLFEREVGSLEPGKRADFVILDRDLLACPIDDIPDTQVLETWLDGRRIAVGR
ncbi:MAG: amidohydrolase [Planctomycetia bacterium]